MLLRHSKKAEAAHDNDARARPSGPVKSCGPAACRSIFVVCLKAVEQAFLAGSADLEDGSVVVSVTLCGAIERTVERDETPHSGDYSSL